MVLSKGPHTNGEIQKKEVFPEQTDQSLQGDFTSIGFVEDDNGSECNGATETESLLCETNGNVVLKGNVSPPSATPTPGDVTIEAKADGAVDSGWGWCIIIGCVLTRMVIGGFIRAQGILYIKFQERFGGSATSTALVMSLGSFLRLAFGTLVSILTNRFSCRTLTVFGAIVSCAGLIASAFTPNLNFLFFSYSAVYGIGRAFALSPTPILLGFYFEKRRSLAFGLATAGFSFGGFILSPVVEMLFERYGFQGTFIVMAGISTHMFISSALFRPIEQHRKLTALKRRRQNENGLNANIETTKSAEFVNGSVACVNTNRDSMCVNGLEQNGNSKTRDSEQKDEDNEVSPTPAHVNVNGHDDKNGNLQMNPSGKYSNGETKPDVLQESNPKQCHREHANGQTRHDAPVENANGQTRHDAPVENHQMNGSGEANGQTNRTLCLCWSGKDSEKEADGQKTKWISFSILKDVRFVSFLLSTVCLALPNTILFLPALAKTRGVSDMKAAYLLSAMAASNTVFRVVSGFVLDLRVFRSMRPELYCAIAFLESFTEALFPLMSTFEGLMAVSITIGCLQGFRLAQGAVIVIDILGVDKFASSQAITSVLMCFSVFVAPVISGQLMDHYGSYDGAFYFFAAAIFAGACIMSFGLVRKRCIDKKGTIEYKTKSK